jgi:hypothetical protein
VLHGKGLAVASGFETGERLVFGVSEQERLVFYRYQPFRLSPNDDTVGNKVAVRKHGVNVKHGNPKACSSRFGEDEREWILKPGQGELATVSKRKPCVMARFRPCLSILQPLMLVSSHEQYCVFLFPSYFCIGRWKL